VRALLDLLRDNEAAVKGFSPQCRYFLRRASVNLKILYPGHGEEELIKSVAAALAKLSQSPRKP
jgi:hypothetical protein